MPEGAKRTWSRRRLLASVAALPILAATADGRSISDKLPWSAFAGDPPRPVDPLGWFFFNAAEAAMVEVIADHLIPADALSPGGKDCGCAVFIDRQLAGSFGKGDRLYWKGPFLPGLPTQGYQGGMPPAVRYRLGLKALNDYARATGGKDFVRLAPARREALLKGMESGTVALKLAPGFTARAFFDLMLQNTMEGFFADPLYGGNKDMAGWKMLGFPGARYDYRDHIDKYNQPYPLRPVSIYAMGS